MLTTKKKYLDTEANSRLRQKISAQSVGGRAELTPSLHRIYKLKWFRKVNAKPISQTTKTIRKSHAKSIESVGYGEINLECT